LEIEFLGLDIIYFIEKVISIWNRSFLCSKYVPQRNLIFSF